MEEEGSADAGRCLPLLGWVFAPVYVLGSALPSPSRKALHSPLMRFSSCHDPHLEK